MWSFGCILAELVTGRPLFPAIDEQELLELMRIRIGMPPEEMIKSAKKRKYFFNQQMKLITSKKSRVPAGLPDRSDSVRRALYSEGDDDFVDFIEVSKSDICLIAALAIENDVRVIRRNNEIQITL